MFNVFLRTLDEAGKFDLYLLIDLFQLWNGSAALVKRIIRLRSLVPKDG